MNKKDILVPIVQGVCVGVLGFIGLRIASEEANKERARMFERERIRGIRYELQKLDAWGYKNLNELEKNRYDELTSELSEYNVKEINRLMKAKR